MSGHKTYLNLPVLGVGFGLREPIFSETITSADLIDWIEIIAENFMGRGGATRQRLLQAKQTFPVVSHGVSLSLGSIDPLDERYLKELEALFEQIDPPWFSDHLCFASFNSHYIDDLLPLPKTEETVNHISDRIKQVQDRIQKPFIVENLAQKLHCPFDTMPDSDFHASILEKADCGLLLDLNNLYVNSRNFNVAPLDFLRNIPLERVVQIHVAGHSISADLPGFLMDTHDDSVAPAVWELLDWTLEHCQPCGVLLERDDHFPPFHQIRTELEHIRRLWKLHGPFKEIQA